MLEIISGGDGAKRLKSRSHEQTTSLCLASQASNDVAIPIREIHQAGATAEGRDWSWQCCDQCHFPKGVRGFPPRFPYPGRAGDRQKPGNPRSETVWGPAAESSSFEAGLSSAQAEKGARKCDQVVSRGQASTRVGRLAQVSSACWNRVGATGRASETEDRRGLPDSRRRRQCQG